MKGDQNIVCYLQLFKGRHDYFAEQGDDHYRPVHNPFGEFYLDQHLRGDATYGLYLLNSESYCHLLCVDIDIPKGDVCAIDISNRIEKYEYLRPKLQAVVDTLRINLGVPSESILLEDTGGRGYHVWVFMAGPLDGRTAVRFGAVLKKHLTFEVEFFPKQGTLNENRKFGNLIKLPLGVHRKYGLRSVFFSICDNGLKFIDGVKENLSYLSSVVPAAPDAIAHSAQTLVNDLPVPDYALSELVTAVDGRPHYDGDPKTLLSQCTALCNIRLKAERGEALDRSEAFHFANAMLSVSGGEGCVHETMRLSFGQKYDQQLCQKEIDNILPLRPTSCFTLVQTSICPEYCKDSVRKRNEDPLAPNTSPCSVWLQPTRRRRVADGADLLNSIATPSNVKSAFFQLRQYHEHEDLLFFDPFDFENFEKHLDANCEVISRALRERDQLATTGFLPVRLPKKLDENLVLDFRTMSYSSIYDLAPIQAVFNCVAPIIEEAFQDTSYGYRWNLDTDDPSRIFEDWRTSYPRFRNAIMAALRRIPNGYHVCCDIKGFYDHVDHEILVRQIRRLVADDYVYRSIEQVVRSYEFQKGCGQGLPQGPAYARLLANLYLNDFDKAAARITPEYFRYVDDLVLVFTNREDAERGLENLARVLSELHLEFSQDEAKKPAINVNSDVTRVRKMLDTIQYGILEGTRHLPHLAQQAVKDFGDAIERRNVSPANLNDLIQINDVLPSLLYVVTQESLNPHPLRKKTCEVIRFLVNRHYFCPKKLKTIFYSLLQLEWDHGVVLELFRDMEPTHKAYFMLSVFARWKSQTEHRELLEEMLHIASTDDDPFVWGFAIAIASFLGIESDRAIQLGHLKEMLSRDAGLFGLLKMVGVVTYDSLSPEEQKSISGLVVANSPDLAKILLLGALPNLPKRYIDGLYFRSILQGASVILLPAVSVLLAAASDATQLFYDLIDFGLQRLPFKSLFISLVTKELFDKRASSGTAELDNLRELYGQIRDPELANAMLGALSRISQHAPACETEFAKMHRRLGEYNECFLFERTVSDASYTYVELIPESRLREYLHRDLDFARNIVADLSASDVLPPSKFVYFSGAGEVHLEFSSQKQYVELDRKQFSLMGNTIQLALRLAAQAYRKAMYFHRKTGKVTPITLDNVLVDATKNTLAFRTVGKCLCVPHLLGGVPVGDEVSDIAKMVSAFLRDLFFENEVAARTFLEERHHTGMEAVLSDCIKNMKGKEPSYRYTCSRFAYLVEQFTEPSDLSEQQICMRYLRERLKASLFRFNSQKITWAGICRALNEHFTEHVRVVCGPEVLGDASFRNRIMFRGSSTRGLHTLSQGLLNLVLNRQDVLGANYAADPYCDLVEFLLLYGIICVETVSLAVILNKKQGLKEFFATSPRSEDVVRVEAAGLGADFAVEDLGALLIDEPKEKRDQSMMALSLRQLAVQSLLSCGVVLIDGHTLKVTKPGRLSDNVFHPLSHACLIRLSQIEQFADRILNSVFSGLRSNEDLASPGWLPETWEAVEILSKDLKKARHSLAIVRRHGHAYGGYFPDILCKSRLRRERIAKEESLPGFALTNSFPTSREGYACSWDLRAASVDNLVIPSEGVNSLMRDLMKGRIFGYKVLYLYSGKALLAWDIAGFIGSGILEAACWLVRAGVGVGQMTKGVCTVGTYVFGPLIFLFFTKGLLYDLKDWLGPNKSVTRVLRAVFTLPRDPS